MIKIGLIGHLAYGREMYDGQTVSTRVWEKELRKRGSLVSVTTVDTYNYRHRILQFFCSGIKCMASCSHIVFMLSGNGMRVMLPVLCSLNKLFHKKIYHRVIGGNLCRYIEKNPKWVGYLNSFEVNWVQSPRLAQELKALGVDNAEYLENFRSAEPIQRSELDDICSKLPPKKFCTFSRVHKAKGIGLAIETIAEVSTLTNEKILLDIYGPVDQDYEEEFTRLLQKNSSVVCYQGSVSADKAVDVLKNYYYHIFPTTWDGEGFPGTIVDCYNAGLPTIASTWAYNREYVKSGETGYLYEWDKPEMLKEKIIKCLADSGNVYREIRRNTLNEAEKYRSTVIMSKILKRMGIGA